MVSTSSSGCPLRMADQRVQPSQTGTAIMTVPSSSQSTASTIRLRAPGCNMPASLDGQLPQR